MNTPQDFYFHCGNVTKLYQILSNGKKVVIWTRHITGGEAKREVIYL